MHRRTKLIIGALTVAIALTAAVASASANRIETSEQQFLVLFRELTFSGGGANVICPVNLEGSFHSKTLSKVNEQLVGYITEGVAHLPCQQGSATVQTSSLPWHIHYESFTGTLPNITGINQRSDNGGFIVEVFGAQCLYEATAASPFKATIVVSGGTVTGLRVNETAAVPKRSGGILCPGSGTLRGTGTVGRQSDWRPITVRLVQ
jgi:hypothetical protein